MTRLSRRGFAQLALRLAALCTSGGAAWSAGDRGLGGTGVVPADPEETIGQDRGIGGTGVVGTIRRFGSIVVNDLRVGYPGDVRVTIDGVRATAADLRIGQVVRVLAHGPRDGMATRDIAVTNEVVGPIEALDRAGLSVLGQRILVEHRPRGGLRLGQTVAVAGLRRLDGTIVASLVVPRREGTPGRLTGPVVLGSDGRLMIGGLHLVGLQSSLVGRRVVLTGSRIGDAFHASGFSVEAVMPSAAVERLSMEGYVARFGDAIRFGSGVTLSAGRTGSELENGGIVRAVVTAQTNDRGILVATGIRVERGSLQSGRGPGQRSSGDVGPPGAPGRQKGAGAGSAPAGAGAPARGGSPAGGRGSGGGDGAGGGGSPGGFSR